MLTGPRRLAALRLTMPSLTMPSLTVPSLTVPRLIALAVLTLLAAGWVGCTGQESRTEMKSAGRDAETTPDQNQRITSAGENPPNILLISIDTLRPDHLGSYGYTRETSPFLDSLAAGGLRFTNAFSTSSWTLPAHVSLLSGTYPHTHQVESNIRTVHPNTPWLAEQLRSAGYHTAGFVSWVYLSAKFGMNRGFDAYEELLPPEEWIDATTQHSIPADAFVDRVIDALPGHHRRPFFLFLHLFDPHMDYAPPLELAQRFDPAIRSTADLHDGTHEALRAYIPGLHPPAERQRVPSRMRERALALYDAEIRFVDDQLRRLFGELRRSGLLESSIVVVTSDHGEEFDEHGSMEGHQWTLYDEVIRVPLFMVFPEGAGRVTGLHEGLVENIDLAPTLLDLAGLPIPPAMEGHSLAQQLRDGTGVPGSLISSPADPSPAVFASITRFSYQWSIRTQTHKLIYTRDTGQNRFGHPITPGFEFYDLTADPAEQHDRSAEESPEFLALMERLRRFVAARGPDLENKIADLSPEEKERLRSVGYVN